MLLAEPKGEGKVMRRLLGVVWLALWSMLFAAAGAVEVTETSNTVTVSASRYRIQFARESFHFLLELRSPDGQWHSAILPDSQPEYAYFGGSDWQSTVSCRANLRWRRQGEAVLVGVSGAVSPLDGVGATVHYLCTERGVLIRFQLQAVHPLAQGALCWALPRLRLNPLLFDSYAFWDDSGRQRQGTLSQLQPLPAYAGVTPWEQQGDIASALSAQTPALIVRSSEKGVALGVLQVGAGWRAGYSFLQQHLPGVLFLYSGYVPAVEAARAVWGWIAPFGEGSSLEWGQQVAQLVAEGEEYVRRFRPIASPIPSQWLQEPPDFPKELRPKQPVSSLQEAIVYTVNEPIHSPYGIRLARKVGSDVLIRGWFKWGNAPDWSVYSPLVREAHQIGALFGGGVTCSVFYEWENGLTPQQAQDMATRDPAGNLVDVAGVAQCRHGSLSNPAYLQYVLQWCQRQIDAGADYLFMDEHHGALLPNEGYDDYSLSDFVRYLLRKFCQQQGWKRDDHRWQERFAISLHDPAICPDGTIATFQYRAYLRQQGCLDEPLSARNPLREEWLQFRHERDERAWKWWTDAIRAYAKGKGRRVYLSANGLAKHVDLQVLGVWHLWKTRDGQVDLLPSQMHDWRRTVREGWYEAGKRVPVVFFHDWGFDGFPWMQVAPSEREIWMRVRGAEIYAAGGFFAFPVLGPFGNDALRDGTLHVVARQSAFYRRHKDLYLRAHLVDLQAVESEQPLLSTALWLRDQPPALIVHVINRQRQGKELVQRRHVWLRLPVQTPPRRAVALSPDAPPQRVNVQVVPGGIRLHLPQLVAYSVILLEYSRLPRWSPGFAPRAYPTWRWEKALQREFRVLPGGVIPDDWKMVAYLQGKLHQQMRQPPTFLLNAPRGARLRVHVRAVAQLGARLVVLVDGKPLASVSLPDRDGKNDGLANEYNRTFDFFIPAGRRRVTLDNQGADWATVEWISFEGDFLAGG